VLRSVEMSVTWGLAHRDLEAVESIGIDEVLWRRGYKFLTVVYQIDSGVRRLLWVGQDRRAKTLLPSAAPGSISSAATCGSRT